MHLKRADVVSNWETRSRVKGFLAKFLIDKAQLFLDDMDFQAFEKVLALLIYELVLFPNPDSFIYVNAIKIFLSRNLVPTLLGDILHTLHTRTMKRRGVLMCCMPLLSRWFISHLPKSILKNEEGLGWSQRIMSLAHMDILWCSRAMENTAIIDRCGEYPNVPLLGIRGGITYNPCLALRQFGYARRDGPHELLIEGIIFNYEDDVQEYRRRFIRAWGMVNRSGAKALGLIVSIPMEPYLQWVRACTHKLMMPYMEVLPVIVEPTTEGGIPYTILYPDMPTDLGELQRSWIQLKKEWDTYRDQFYA